MIILERREKILRILEQRRSASIKELASEIFISEASIRRDVEALEKDGIVKRVYGGVTIDTHRNTVTPLELRDSANSAKKEIIARKAADLVKNGDTLMLDSSSTARRMIKYLYGKRDLKIITNNARIFSECEDQSIELFCTGGYYISNEQAFAGAGAEEYVKSIYADIFFFSSSAISVDGEISDVSEIETSLRKTMLTRARRKVFLCDSSKFGDRRTFLVCHKDELSDIISDEPLPWE